MHKCIIPYSTSRGVLTGLYPTIAIVLQVHVHGVCSYMHNISIPAAQPATVISGPDTCNSQLYHRAIAIQYTALAVALIYIMS